MQRSSAFMPCVVLFPEFCLANHRCNPKAMYVPYFGERGFKIDARAQVNIKEGEEITIRYIIQKRVHEGYFDMTIHIFSPDSQTFAFECRKEIRWWHSVS